MNLQFTKSIRIGARELLVLVMFIQCPHLFAQKQSQINPDDLLAIVQAYADAMIVQGRDIYGSEKTPLFASALNRETMKPDQPADYRSIPGVRERDRSLTGANLIHDIDFLHILYELSAIYGNKEYEDEANKALQYFFNNCQSANTGLMCWGEHLHWNFYTDNCAYASNYDFHETKDWPFWDQSYALASEACLNFVLGEWDHQIHNKATGDFSRHARYSEHGTYSGFDFPRYAGQMMERWADAYRRLEKQNNPRREEFLSAINVLFIRMLENQKLSESGYLIAGRSPQGDHVNLVWLRSNLKLARCLEEVAPIMSPEIAKQMKEFALKQDIDFINAPHKLDSVGGGFAVTLHAQTGLPRNRSMNKPYTSNWSSGYGYGTHAGTANLCSERYEKLKNEHPDLASSYKKLLLKAADYYLHSSPDTAILLKPSEFSELVNLMLNCYQMTGQKKYINRALYFAQTGINLFLNDGLPLPKATTHHEHYESITGGPSFMHALLKIHLVLKDGVFNSTK